MIAMTFYPIRSSGRSRGLLVLPPGVHGQQRLSDRDLGVAPTGNAEAVEDCPRRVGAIEGVEVDSGYVAADYFRLCCAFAFAGGAAWAIRNFSKMSLRKRADISVSSAPGFCASPR
jgi:hypothetical protein